MYAWRWVATISIDLSQGDKSSTATTKQQQRNRRATVIWNDERLRTACEEQDLVSPFDPACVNPASIDLRLGTSYRRPDRVWNLHPTGWILTDTPPTWAEEQHMAECGILLEAGEFILCCSLEVVRLPIDCCGVLYSKSSTGRRGLEHMHAGYVDPGFCGQLTFEFHNVAPWPIHLVPGSRVMQMCLDQMIAPAVQPYAVTGRYQNQVGATPAREVR
jgi:dCTP deaminase